MEMGFENSMPCKEGMKHPTNPVVDDSYSIYIIFSGFSNLKPC